MIGRRSWYRIESAGWVVRKRGERGGGRRRGREKSDEENVVLRAEAYLVPEAAHASTLWLLHDIQTAGIHKLVEARNWWAAVVSVGPRELRGGNVRECEEMRGGGRDG